MIESKSVLLKLRVLPIDQFPAYFKSLEQGDEFDIDQIVQLTESKHWLDQNSPVSEAHWRANLREMYDGFNDFKLTSQQAACSLLSAGYYRMDLKLPVRTYI